MANRHKSRSIVLQTLFEWDVQQARGTTLNTHQILTTNTQEFAGSDGDIPFMEVLLKGVLEKREEIDEIIQKAAPEWPIDKISVSDRNILRIGLYELLYGDRDDVPPKVAINEAIELSKSFGGENSSKFVNGVLGAVYKDIGEPQKEEAKPRKKGKDLPVQHLCGAVVFARTNEGLRFALVHDIFGRWTLSKARKQSDEEPDNSCAVRAVRTELGLEGEVLEEIGANEYIAMHPEEGKMKKSVRYYLVEVPFGDLQVDMSGGLDSAGWFTPEDLKRLTTYDDIEPIISKAVVVLGEK